MRNTTCSTDSKKPQESYRKKDFTKEDEKNKNIKQTQENCAEKPSHIQTQYG